MNDAHALDRLDNDAIVLGGRCRIISNKISIGSSENIVWVFVVGRRSGGRSVGGVSVWLEVPVCA